tara:strand:- start:100 stop:477 length:378 start_codon:yes stop_codon:yes gene_type:complete
MAAPNLVNVTSIYGKTAFDADVSSSGSELLENAASSNKLLKINSLIIANIDGTNTATITVEIRNSASSGVHSTLAKTVTVPPDAVYVAISKDTPIYLEEDKAIYLTASLSGDLSATCSYDEIDDA